MERTVGLVGDTEASRTKRNVPPEEHTTPEMSMFRYVRPMWLGCWIWGWNGAGPLLVLRHSEMARRTKRPSTPQQSIWESLLHIHGILQGLAPQVPSSVTSPPRGSPHPPYPPSLHRQMTDDRRLFCTRPLRSAVVAPPACQGEMMLFLWKMTHCPLEQEPFTP